MNTVNRKVSYYINRVKSKLYDARRGLQKVKRNIRNVFTNEQELELSALSKKYFLAEDTLWHLKANIEEIIGNN